jgi:hypothetical protein
MSRKLIILNIQIILFGNVTLYSLALLLPQFETNVPVLPSSAGQKRETPVPPKRPVAIYWVTCYHTTEDTHENFGSPSVSIQMSVLKFPFLLLL